MCIKSLRLSFTALKTTSKNLDLCCVWNYKRKKISWIEDPHPWSQSFFSVERNEIGPLVQPVYNVWLAVAQHTGLPWISLPSHCHTHSRGCLGWQLSFMPLRRLEQHSPRRAPACSTRTCLIAYITIEQAKLSVHSEYSTWQHRYKSPYRATGRGKKRIWDFLSICPKQSSSKSVLPQSSQVCMGSQGKTSDGCSQPQTLPKGEAQTHSAGDLWGRMLVVWAGHSPALPMGPSTAQLPCTRWEGERKRHSIPVPAPFASPPCETGVQEEQVYQQESRRKNAFIYLTDFKE